MEQLYFSFSKSESSFDFSLVFFTPSPPPSLQTYIVFKNSEIHCQYHLRQHIFSSLPPPNYYPHCLLTFTTSISNTETQNVESREQCLKKPVGSRRNPAQKMSGVGKKKQKVSGVEVSGEKGPNQWRGMEKRTEMCQELGVGDPPLRVSKRIKTDSDSFTTKNL